MKEFKISLIALAMFVIPMGSVYSENPAQTGAQESGISDYMGVSLEVPEETQKLIGLTTRKVEFSQTAGEIPVNGRISQDVDQITEVFAAEPGIVKECLAPIGSMVSRGQVICVIESKASRALIEVHAPASGVVVADFEKAGGAVDTLFPVHVIADLSKLFANFDVYENDIGKVKIGQKTRVYSSAYPDRSFEGRIVFISPRVDETSFTTKIRVQIDNPDYLLKPGMFVRADIILESPQAHFIVPADAVQRLGGTDVVFVRDEKESFIPTEIRVAFAGRNQALFVGEMNEGDVVVVDGAYILKSKILESEITGGCGGND